MAALLKLVGVSLVSTIALIFVPWLQILLYDWHPCPLGEHVIFVTSEQGKYVIFVTVILSHARAHTGTCLSFSTIYVPFIHVKFALLNVLAFRSALDGECGFLAANLYAKSVFGEDALVNVSIEKQADGKLSGYIRIRSKTQGIALSLGDKITLKQKGGS